MDQNLFSLRTHFLWKSVKAFLLFFLLLMGGKTFAQYSGMGTFTKVTSAAGFTDGYYVVAYGTTQAMNNTHNGTFFANTSISPTSGTTITNPSKAIVWKIETNGTGKSIYNEDANVFASYTGSSNNVQAVSTVTTNNQRWSFNYSGGTFDVQNLGVSGRSLQYNTSAPRFACYTGSQQDITLYKMASTSYTVTFNANTGTGTMAAQSASSATALTANAFAKTGYAFGGWSSSVANATAGTIAYANQANYPFTSSTTLYAAWSFGITYNSNGGTGTIASQTGYYNASTNSGSLTLSSGAGLTRAGFTFAGWKTTAAGTSANYAASDSYTHSGSSSAITLYAHWVANSYTLTYNGNGNNTGTPPATQTGSNSYTVSGNTDLVRYGGYYWMGWTVNPDGSGTAYGPGAAPFVNTISLSANTTLYARWVYTVLYLGNGNTGGTVPAQQTNYNSLPTTLSGAGTMVRAGYTFGGWKTDANGTIADYAAGASFTPNVNVGITQLHAHWIKNPPKFTVTPTTLSGFNYVETNGPSAVQSFVLNGNDLENTDTDPVELVTIDDRFEISETVSGTYSHSIELPSTYTGASKTFYVRLKAGLTAANYTDTVLVSGGSAIEANYAEVALSGSVTACLAPTTQSSVASFASLTSSGVTVNLTTGNGVGRVVVINTVNSFTNPVSSNALPVANTVYGSGEQVIYAGTGNSVAVTGLAPSTTYYVRVYEYNICSGNYIYNTTTVTNNPRTVTTPCQVPVTPNGEITPLENPVCTTAVLIYEIGTLDQDNMTAGATFYWQTTAAGTSTANPVVFANGSSASEPYSVTVSGNYYVRAYNGFCWSTGSYVTQEPISILSAPTITTQPTNQSVVAGANASFSVAASGSAPFTYQWQESPTGAAGTWVNIGTSSSTLTLTNVPLSKNGYKYHVIVSNDCVSRTSNVATLSVITGPCFEETFNAITAGNNTSTSGSSSIWSGNTNFPTTSTVYQAGGAIRIGTTASGTITSRNLSEVSGNITVELDVKGWTTVEGSFNITINGVTKNVTYDNKMVDGFETVTAEFENVPAGSQLTISTTRRGFLDAVRVYCANSCTPATIAAFPTSGPANTIVTITGTNFTATSTVKFGSANAVVQYISATQIKATVPTTADGDIVVDTALDCDSETAFTFIKEDASGCEAVVGSGTGTVATDLIIYEVYDENGGSGGTVSIYNGTNATVNLTNYSFFRANDYGVSYGSYGTLSGSLPAGGLAVIGVSGSACGYVPTGNGSIGGGFNANDGLQLRKGSVVVDDFKAPNYVGYYLKRKNGFLSPKATFVESEWTTEGVEAGQCLANVASELPAVRTPPVITAQPSYVINCDVVNTSLVLTATEGYVGGNALTYQWYELKNTGTWTAIVDGGVYSGATSQTLTISDVDGLNNYQYYCQVRENTQTCYTATQATQIKEASNTWASNVWTNGTPVLGSKVIIAGSYNTQTNGALDVCDLTINAGGTLRVRPNFPVTVKKKITNNGSAANFIVESDANLIQTDNVTNEGDIQVQRSVTNMNNNAAVAIDYVYWSSPVSGQTIKGTGGFSPNTPANGYLQYNESNDKFTVTNDAIFQAGKGYAIRAEAGTDGYNKTYNFNGIPNNGNIQYQNLKWTDANHGFNLVGNPYPSNIDFDLLYQLNSAKMYSTVWFWTNNSYTAGQVGSGYNGNNYAVYNGTGGSPATYNPENPYDGSVVPNGKIKVGQAFIIQSKAGGKDQPLNFSNNMRVTDNGNFYQKSISKNRFWLNMTSPSNLVNTILVGYIEGATNNYETDFDGELFAVGSDSFYSILGARKLAIQGKANNFSVDDVISIGNVFAVDGTYKIKLQTAEGIFETNQKVYLRDKLLNQYFDLNSNETYTFTATKGTNNNRFEIVYKEGTLNNNETKKSDFQIYRNGQAFVIESSQQLGNIELYDAGGKLIRQIYSKEKKLVVDASTLPHGVYIIKAENSGILRTKKIIK